MAERAIDMAAVARVARRVDLLEICLAEMFAKAQRGPKGTLEAELAHDGVPLRAEDGLIEVDVSYQFKVTSSNVQVAEAKLKYHLVYQLSGSEPVADEDLKQFAYANGAYHSWPFVREMLFGLTARMGFPPYTLPVLSFVPPRPAAPRKAVPPPADQPMVRAPRTRVRS